MITSPERSQFPALANGLVYLDSAATALKPTCVVDAVTAVYTEGEGAAHRGTFALAARATAKIEAARGKVAALLGARDERIVFCRGVTEGLNMLARGLAESLSPGDEIVVSELCHHASFVGFSLAAARVGATLRVAKVTPDGDLTVDAIAACISPRTKVVSLPHVSNVTGAVLDAGLVAELARRVNAIFVLDGAQAFPHLPVDVATLGCDAYVLGAHKAYGPSGVGVLHANAALLATLPPLHGGGHMVLEARADELRLAPAPARHEAGTPNLEGIAGFSAAIDLLVAARARGAIAREQALVGYLRERLEGLPFVRIVGRGRGRPRVALVSFEVEGCHPHDVATLLDEDGVAVRAGRMCAHPLFAAIGSRGALRASIALYNDSSDVDRLVAGLVRAHAVLHGAP